MGGNTKNEREAGDCGKACTKLRKVPSRGPENAEVLVLLLAAVSLTCRERPTLVVRILDLAPVGWTRQWNDNPLAETSEAVLNSCFGT